jgi:hypothetical protein
MAHHQHEPNHSHDEANEKAEFNIRSTSASTSDLSHSSHQPATKNVLSGEKRKSIFDYQIGGFPWSFVFVVTIIAIGVLGIILKAMGMF